MHQTRLDFIRLPTFVPLSFQLVDPTFIPCHHFKHTRMDVHTLTVLINLKRQMKPFPNPLELFHLSIWERTQGEGPFKKTLKVTAVTAHICLGLLGCFRKFAFAPFQNQQPSSEVLPSWLPQRRGFAFHSWVLSIVPLHATNNDNMLSTPKKKSIFSSYETWCRSHPC